MALGMCVCFGGGLRVLGRCVCVCVCVLVRVRACRWVCVRVLLVCMAGERAGVGGVRELLC